MLSVRGWRKRRRPTVSVGPEGIVVVPAPESVPPFQLKAEVTLSDCVPVMVPLFSVSVATLTGTSRVTVKLVIVAVSPAPGTPAPPQVEALLQLPLWLAVNVAAPSGS